LPGWRGKGPQRLLQKQLRLGAGPLDLALKGAQLLMKAPPDLAHQPNLPVLSASVSGLSWLQSEAPPNATHTLAITRELYLGARC
jgi:hypothetical protein